MARENGCQGGGYTRYIRCIRSTRYRENGCQGGQLGGAWNYAKKTGLVEESCYPYLKSQGGPVPTCDPSAQPCLPESKFIQVHHRSRYA